MPFIPDRTPGFIPDEEQPKKNLFGTIASGIKQVGEAPGQLATGFAKTLGSTAVNMAELGSRGLDYLGEKMTGTKIDSPALLSPVKEKLQPSNILQKAGVFIGEAAQYLTPVGVEAGIAKTATTLDKILSKSPKLIKAGSELLAKSGIIGAEFAGKTALMTGDAEQTKQAGMIGFAAPPAIKAVGKTAKFVLGDVVPSVLSGMTGIAPEAIKSAFKNPVETAKYIAKKVIPVEVREKAIQSLGKYEATVGESFETGLNSLKSKYKTGVSGYPNIQFNKQVNDVTKGIPSIFRKFKVAVIDNNTILDFDKLNSAIVKGGEQSNLQRVYDTIRNQTDYSVSGVQDVAARINALSKFADGIKTQTSAVISQIHRNYSKAIEKSFPELGKLRAEYSASKEIMSGIDDILKSAKNDIANPITSTSVAKKLVNLFNEDNEAYVRALKKLEDATGDDLINQFVAANFDKIMPGKLGSYMMQAGLIAGGIAYNPTIIAALPLFSPKVAGIVLTNAGKAAKILENVVSAIPSSIKEKLFPASIIGGK